MTMTTREVTIFLGELGQLREKLGVLAATIATLEARLESIGDLLDRIDAVEKSLAVCQSTCGQDRRARAGVWRWVAYSAAGIVPAAAGWYFMRHIGGK